MLRKSVHLLLAAAALLAIGLGAVSHVQPIPDHNLWIDEDDTTPRLVGGVVNGAFHLVYVGPQRAGKNSYSLGFSQSYYRSVNIGRVSAIGLGVPFPVMALVLGIWPLLALQRGPLRRYRRRRQGRCSTCGYNLSGLVSGRCPECGAVTAPRTPAAST